MSLWCSVRIWDGVEWLGIACSHWGIFSGDRCENQGSRYKRWLHSRSLKQTMRQRLRRVPSSPKLTLDENCTWLRTMECLLIAHVEPNDWDWDQRKQEMLIINSPNHEPVGIYCTPNEWDEVKQSFEQCGWATFMAQQAQVGPAQHHLQIAK